jgi:hypothetical protein
MLAHRRADVAALNQLARERLRDRGHHDFQATALVSRLLENPCKFLGGTCWKVALRQAFAHAGESN